MSDSAGYTTKMNDPYEAAKRAKALDIARRSKEAKVTGSWQPWWDDIDYLTAKLAAAETERDYMSGVVDLAHDRALAAEAKLAKATAVVDAAERVSSSAGAHFRCVLCDKNGYGHATSCRLLALNQAIANYHAGPAETEEE